MPFQLPPLPFSPDALEPLMSRETIELHYGKHHQAYVDKSNELLQGTILQHSTLEEVVRESQGKLFNQAAQAWNHAFFWHCLRREPRRRQLSREVQVALDRAFGGRQGFLERFANSALELFGSGWTWLVKDEAGELSIVNLSNADTPLRGELVPLLVLDVWEHAYYLDHRNDRKAYVDGFRQLIDWRFVSERYDAPDCFDATVEMGRAA